MMKVSSENIKRFLAWAFIGAVILAPTVILGYFGVKELLRGEIWWFIAMIGCGASISYLWASLFKNALANEKKEKEERLEYMELKIMTLDILKALARRNLITADELQDIRFAKNGVYTNAKTALDLAEYEKTVTEGNDTNG